MKQTLLLLWLAMASLTWAAPDKTKTVEVDNLFQIDLPEFMSNASGLHEGVRFMYQHALLYLAFQVLAENK